MLSLQACTKQKAGSTREVSVSETQGLLNNDFAILLDVREQDELAAGMAAPALWFPTSKAVSGSAEWEAFLEKLPKDKEIVIYCASGGRAGRVASELAGRGYRTANMGGFFDWAKAGMPVKNLKP